MAALAFALHVLGAVVWVGGMFAIYVCLRPALVTLEPPQRLRLMRVTFQTFPGCGRRSCCCSRAAIRWCS
jgi:uncharacterized membrane protein